MILHYKKVILSLFIFLTALSIFSCSASKTGEEGKITFTEVNCWLNLMPGSESSFNLSGEFIADKSDMDSLRLDSVMVYQKGSLLYKFYPFIKSIHNYESGQESDSKVRYLFGTAKGFEILKKLDPDLNVDIMINFFIGNEKFHKEIKDLPVEKAY